jgi:hypothetical protein
MTVRGRLSILAAVAAVSILACGTMPEVSLPEYESSSLRPVSVVRARIPNGEAFRVYLQVQNLSDAPVTVGARDTAFVQVRSWYAANKLQGTQLQLFTPASESTARISPRSTESHEVRFAYLTGGSYVRDLEDGESTLTSGPLTVSAMRRLELQPPYALSFVPSGTETGMRPASGRRPGYLVVRVGPDTHVIPVDVP